MSKHHADVTLTRGDNKFTLNFAVMIAHYAALQA